MLKVIQKLLLSDVKVTHHPNRLGTHKHCGTCDMFICLLNNGCCGNGKKRHCFSYHSNSCKEYKILHQKHESFTFEIPPTKLSWLNKCNATKNVATSKWYILSKRAQKVKTTFHNFVLNVETGWAIRLASPFYKMEMPMYVYTPYFAWHKVFIWNSKK